MKISDLSIIFTSKLGKTLKYFVFVIFRYDYLGPNRACDHPPRRAWENTFGLKQKSRSLMSFTSSLFHWFINRLVFSKVQ